MSSQDPSDIKQQVREVWDRNADFWDERMGEGNVFHRTLVAPTQVGFLALRPGELVLDIACGNGQFAREMARLGARVVALDISSRMIEHARARTKENADLIKYSVMDATDEEGLRSLGTHKFDAAVCTMAIMDIPSIEPLASALTHLLKPGGRFVFSVSHPCFNSTNGLTRMVELEETDGRLIRRHSVKISEYVRSYSYKGTAMADQPVPHYYFHRPISLLLTTFFSRGFVLDGLEEPVFPKPEPSRPLSQENFSEIPWALVARMRLMQPSA